MSSQGQPRIFIVEDNFTYSYLLEAMFKERENFKITSFSNSKECIDLLDNNPDVIILDYNLGDGINGMDVFKSIHKAKPNVPVIIMSSQNDVQVVADILKAGAFDYVEKKNIETTTEKLRLSVLKALKR